MKNTQLSTKPVLESYDILPAEAYMKKKILVVMLMIAALRGYLPLLCSRSALLWHISIALLIWQMRIKC